MSFATSVSVRCSRLRNSLFGRRNGPTARFWMAGLTNRSFVLAGIFASYRSSLLVQETFYEQYARRFCASFGPLMMASKGSAVHVEGARVFGRNRPVPHG